MKPILFLLAALAGLVACDNRRPISPDKAADSKSNAPSAAGQEKRASEIVDAIQDPADADLIKVGDSEVTFAAPEGFKQLSKEHIAKKWPTDRAPVYVVGTPTGSTTVAYDFKPHQVPQEALPEVQKSFTQLFGRMIPGIDWKKNEIVEHAGQKWLLMEMTSNAVDTDIYNIMMLTGFDDKMLIFNFNSTKEDFPTYEAALRKSLKSIKLPK